MPCADFQFPGQRGRDLIDPERLALHLVDRLCQDDIPLLQVIRVDALRRVLHLQLIAPVPLLRDHAGLAVGELPDTVVGILRFRRIIKAWDHSVHHLGVTST